MHMNAYQLEAVETAIYNDRMYPIASLMVEAAEYSDLFIKPYLRGDDYEPERDMIIAEAGDVLWNLAASLYDHGITLEEVAQYNVKKLQSRAARGVIKGSGGNR